MTTLLRLHDYPLSGNCFKVRQLLAWLAVPYEAVPVDFYPGARTSRPRSSRSSTRSARSR